MEKEKFSEDWKAAFEDAEVTPSASVWSNIDLKLENEKMKRSVVYYQRLAAASVFFALLLGGYGVRYFSSNNNSLVTSTQKTEPKIEQENLASSSSLGNNTLVRDKNELTKKSNSTNNDGEEIQRADSFLDQREANQIQTSMFSTNRLSVDDERDERSIKNTDNAFTKLNSFITPQLSKTEMSTIEKEKELTRNVPEVPGELISASKKHRRKDEDLWLSFGAGAGSYNPGNGSQNQTSSSSAFANAPQNSMDSKPSSIGTAYSMGLTVGKKIGQRWVMQTGINYMNQMLSYTSNFATYDASNRLTASVAEYAGKNSLTITQPYKINSSMEFVSVPVQAGFLIVDRKLGLQFNAGFATDIFLRNTLQDQSGQASKYSEGSGEESPYRSFNWAGLASTELSYKLAQHYRISLMPGLRYSFQPLLKSPTSGTASPFVLDVGFRFKYIFK